MPTERLTDRQADQCVAFIEAIRAGVTAPRFSDEYVGNLVRAAWAEHIDFREGTDA